MASLTDSAKISSPSPSLDGSELGYVLPHSAEWWGFFPMGGLLYYPRLADLLEWADRSQIAQVRRFISQQAPRYQPIVAVEAQCRASVIDLLFVVEGDLYDGETAVLPLMRALRQEFPDVAFDVMVLPSPRGGQVRHPGAVTHVLFSRAAAQTSSELSEAPAATSSE